MDHNPTVPFPVNGFHRFDLPASLLGALAQMNYSEPTPIQAQAIPPALEGKDLIGLAQTGTGKTAAFALPLITQLIKNPERKALILVPTRELANQVLGVLHSILAKNKEMQAVSLIGGVSIHLQTKALKKGFRIVVATPGRLIDHLETQPRLLEKASIVVMDEADRMLDLGFAPQLNRIEPCLPSDRQVMLFSATFSKTVEELSKRYLRNPVRIQTQNAHVPVEKIEQATRFVEGAKKSDALLDEVNAREGSILVFVRTKRRTDRVARNLASYGVPVAAIHGDKSQGQRNQAIRNFKDQKIRVLCATDLIARGIDIDHVAHVINYDLPEVPEDYVHRIGRTGRNGRDGKSLSLISPEEKNLWTDIQKLLNRTAGPKVQSRGAPLRPSSPPKKIRFPRHSEERARGT